jgi:hypothetical protein
MHLTGIFGTHSVVVSVTAFRYWTSHVSLRTVAAQLDLRNIASFCNFDEITLVLQPSNSKQSDKKRYLQTFFVHDFLELFVEIIAPLGEDIRPLFSQNIKVLFLITVKALLQLRSCRHAPDGHVIDGLANYG